jgi:hypothetical protein
MPPDRFDDVEFRIIDAPEPGRAGRHHRRWVAAGAATVLAVGALAAGASALTGGEDAPPAAAPPANDSQFHRFGHHGHGCHHHGGDSGWSGHAPDASKL